LFEVTGRLQVGPVLQQQEVYARPLIPN
jgi:hypothetical protein